MKSFAERVKHNQEHHEGLHVFRVIPNRVPELREPVDLVCITKHGKVTLIRARENGHGHLNPMTVMRLQQLGMQCGARVLHAKVNGENEIVFKIIHEKK